MVAALFQTLDTHFFAMFSYGAVWTNDFHRLSVTITLVHYYMKFNGLLHWDITHMEPQPKWMTVCLSWAF